MNKYYLYGAGALIVLAGIFIITQSKSSRSITTTAITPPTRTQTQLPTPVTASTSAITTAPTATTPQDIVPGLYPNPIKNTARISGIKITSIIVENNTDTTKNAVSDHLQVTLQNLTGKTLSNLEAYYTIVDTATGKRGLL